MNGLGSVSVPAASSRSGADGEKRPTVPETFVGHDVLELVSSAMHVDPMAVYREYVQNAADAIDAARLAGGLSAAQAGRVDISVDRATRTVRIRDNGCGVAAGEFGHRLTAFGGSVKRGRPVRGFRGVGRLAGLAYSQELVFRSRASGDPAASELRWDCRKLKALLRERDEALCLADLVRRVTVLRRLPAAGLPDPFFEVEMRGIVRLRNDALMSPSAIAAYLSQVAPVPFSPQFRFASAISTQLAHYVDLTEVEIRIDDATEPLYRPHRDTFDVAGKPSVSFETLDFLEIPGAEDHVAAVAWILHHEYQGALPTESLVKGLRARSGNMQVGGRAVLEGLFPESRFNGWSVGEVHVIDRRIIPNGRRDNFEQNVHYYNLVNHLGPAARDIAHRCRSSSVRRKGEREFESQAQAAAELIGVLSQGSVDQLKQRELALSAEKALLQMMKIAGRKLLNDGLIERQKKIEVLRRELSAVTNEHATVTSPLARLPDGERKSYEHVFRLVYECSTNRSAAKALVDRILLRIAEDGVR
ncbi:MAG: molecular chaperone Hsp90 [Acidobacteria bacterium]|nr:molecular chaperone Hsp90 [Acidobacteriota bacterium]